MPPFCPLSADVLCAIVASSWSRHQQGDQMGEFSPIGWLLNLGSFFLITKIEQSLGLIFAQCKLCIILTKNGLGYVLGNFFTN
jgi:hypothetical protein